MYRCRKCGKSSNRGEPMLKKIVYRVDEKGRASIHQEIPLCVECHAKEPVTNVISPAVSPKYNSPKIGDTMEEGI